MDTIVRTDLATHFAPLVAKHRGGTFLGRKPRAALSAKTSPEPLDAARERLAARIARLHPVA